MKSSVRAARGGWNSALLFSNLLMTITDEAKGQPSEPAGERASSQLTRLFVACSALSAWMILLLTGHVLGGTVHSLLVVCMVSFPWRAGSEPVGPIPDRGQEVPEADPGPLTPP